MLCAITTAVSGQNEGESAPEAAAALSPAGASQSESTPLSLAEVRAAGALLSSYRNQQPRPGGADLPEADLVTFQQDIEPILQQACNDCHGVDLQEGEVQIDALDPDLFHGDDVNWWLEVLAVLTNSEMPPVDEGELSDEDRIKVIEWLSSEIQKASAVRRAERAHSSFRRMTRYEYSYALQDLLGLPFDFGKDLPPESNSEDGFQNSSEMLHMSSIQFGTYLESGRNALNRAIVRGDQPQPFYWGVSMKARTADALAGQEQQLEKIREQHKDDPEKRKQELEKKAASFRVRLRQTHYKKLSTGQTSRVHWAYNGAKHAWKATETRPEVPAISDQVVIIPHRQKLVVELGDKIPDHGTLRIRVRASRVSVDDDRLPSLQLEFGWQASNDSSASVKISQQDVAIDAAPNQAKFYEWEFPVSELSPRNAVRKTAKMGELPSPSEFVKLVNSSLSKGDILIDYVEITAPVYDQWPPESHTRIFIDSDKKADELAYAEQVLTNFMSRAWRREASQSEVEQKLALFHKIRPQCDDFQQAVTEVLATVLASPKFLYLVQADSEPAPSRALSSTELATRLSMFLWSSTPDEELLNLATSGRLSDPAVLAGQVERMLADERADRYSKKFVRQWLGMQLLDYLDVDRKAYPRFDRALKEAMQKEPIALFQEVLQKDSSVLDFLHADYTMANERLAQHYGVKEIYGNHFRRVKLEEKHSRGGLLTQAGLLAMNSDGKDAHPAQAERVDAGASAERSTATTTAGSP